MKDYSLDGNKEMVALGTMNIVGSMTSCYVATGMSKNNPTLILSTKLMVDFSQ